MGAARGVALVVLRPAVTLNQITTIRGDGADLSWTPYVDPTPGTFTGDDLGEYQVHRSTKQTFNPTNLNLVAPVLSPAAFAPPGPTARAGSL